MGSDFGTIRSPLVQPLFGDQVVLAARAGDWLNARGSSSPGPGAASRPR